MSDDIRETCNNRFITAWHNLVYHGYTVVCYTTKMYGIPERKTFAYRKPHSYIRLIGVNRTSQNPNGLLFTIFTTGLLAHSA